MMYVFTYGILTNTRVMRQFVGKIIDLGRVTLQGYRLELRQYYSVTQDSNSSIEGVLWGITEDDLKKIDYCEGYPVLYQRSEVTVSTGQVAWVYHDCANELSRPEDAVAQSPSNIVCDGYNEHGIPLSQLQNVLLQTV